MTQKEKVKIERKNKLKKFFLKTLHIISYIFSIGFITILIISGCQSCQKTSSVSAESLNDYNINELLSNYDSYHLKWSSQVELDGTLLTNLMEQCDVPTGPQSLRPGEGDIVKSFDLGDSYSLNVNDNSIQTANVLVMLFSIHYQNGDTNLRFYRLDYIAFSNYDIFQMVLTKYSDNADSTIYVPRNYQFLFTDDVVNSIPQFHNFFDIGSSSSFIFNKNFNYNAPMMVSNRSPYGTGVTGGVSQGTLYTKLVIECGWFVSNNQLFNSIEFWYILSDGLSFDFDGTIKQGPQGMWSYWCTYYVNSVSNSMIIVNNRDSVAYMPSSSSYGYYQANSSTWSNDNYRYITFLENLSNFQKNQIEQFNNNNQNSFSGNIYIEGGDVFTLLGTAFNSLGDFFGLAILPGISIGVLFFLPLIVGIIVVMFHILKK